MGDDASETIFSKIVHGEIPSKKVYEDEEFYAFLDIRPKTKGHTLVIPKEPSRTLLEMDEDLLSRFGPVVQKIARALKTALKADGVNVTFNCEDAGGQEVFHTHAHIIPRYIGDGLEMTWPSQDFSSTEPDEVLRLVRSVLLQS